MPDAKFVLKEPNSKEETLIYLLFRFDNQKLKYSTAEKVIPGSWNKTKQRVKMVRDSKEITSLNNRLDDLAKTAKTTHRDLINKNIRPTPHKIKEALDQEGFKKEYAQKTTFLKFAKDLKENGNRKLNTTKQWGQTIRILEAYKTATKKEVDFDAIDLDFYNSFIQYLIKQNYSKNSIGGFIKNVKIFMNEAVDRKLTTNHEYRNRKFKVISEEVDKIYLTITELKNIYDLDLMQKPRLAKVRDLFIVACYTGLRFSDLIQVTPENIISNGTQIKIRTEKTSEIIVIPLQTQVKEIIAKYDGRLPAVISNQKMNDYLKEIGEEAKISETVKTAITKGGQTQNNIQMKYELITTHTARRSFATNAYLNDVPSISIMKITGHRTEASFMKYIRISQEDNANKLINHPFFK
jgi:integrase